MQRRLPSHESPGTSRTPYDRPKHMVSPFVPGTISESSNSSIDSSSIMGDGGSPPDRVSPAPSEPTTTLELAAGEEVVAPVRILGWDSPHPRPRLHRYQASSNCYVHSARAVRNRSRDLVLYSMEPSFLFSALDRYESSLLMLTAIIPRTVGNLWIAIRMVAIVGARGERAGHVKNSFLGRVVN